MARNDPTIYMRIPQELKDALDKASEENRRSLTAEVVSRLQSTFAQSGQGQALFQLHAYGEGGPVATEMTPAQRVLSERLDKMEKDLEILVAGVKGGRFGKVSAAEETGPKKKP